jgi:hypothetical protein
VKRLNSSPSSSTTPCGMTPSDSTMTAGKLSFHFTYACAASAASATCKDLMVV